MLSYAKFSIIVIGIILVISVSAGFAEQASAVDKTVSAVESINADALSFPYFAEITSNDVYIRSGPGTNHYYCGKLNKGEKVKVVSRNSAGLELFRRQEVFPGFQNSMLRLMRMLRKSEQLLVTRSVYMRARIISSRYTPKKYSLN